MAIPPVFPLADFRAMYPAFDAVPDGTVQAIADAALCYIPAACCSATCWEQLWMIATAHMLQQQAQAASGGAGGQVASATVGSVSVSYAAAPVGNSAAKAWWAGSPYGLQFLALRKRCGAGLPQYVGGFPASRPWR